MKNQVHTKATRKSRNKWSGGGTHNVTEECVTEATLSARAGGLPVRNNTPEASSLEEEYNIKQWGQPDIDILNAPYQHLKPMVRQAATRNRTAAAEDTREEHEDLQEIDTFATKADEKNITKEDVGL